MKKSELLLKCKEYGIKGVSHKTKNEILLLINEQNLNNAYVNKDIFKNKFLLVLEELKNTIPKDKLRKVCKNCNELGHNSNSNDCKLVIEKNNKLKNIIKEYILSQDCFEDKNIDDFCQEISILLNITTNMSKSFLNEIPLNEFLNRKMDINKYLIFINKLLKKCYDCNKNIIFIQSNTHRIWKGNYLCDSCWFKYENDRRLLWESIKKYKSIQCNICGSIKKFNSERYHYDHLNMFNKGNSICNMVNEGVNIEEIYCEIDKCQILCLSCHHIVTDIEHKIGFTRIKQTLTKSLNRNEITENEYNEQKNYYQNIYFEKMNFIYKQLKLLLFNM